MTAALQDQPNEDFSRPLGIKSVVVSKASGKLPSADTPDGDKVSEIFASFSAPTEIDDIYKQVEVNGKDNLLPNAYTPKEYIQKKVFFNHHDPVTYFPSWLAGIKKWVAKQQAENSNFIGFPPTEETKMFAADTAKNVPTIQIISPSAFSTITENKVSVEVKVEAKNGADRVVFFLNDRKVPSSTKHKEPFTGTVKFPPDVKAGAHTITAKIFDKFGYVSEAKIEIKYEGSVAQ